MRISTDNLSFSYDEKKNVFHNVTLTLPEKGLIYIVGESGSGKSTFLKVIFGLIDGYHGSVKWNGKELSSLSLNKRTGIYSSLISFSFQDDVFEEDISVEEAVETGLVFSSLDEGEKRRRIENVLYKVGLYSLRKKKVRELSGGERHRISLARAIVKDAEVYVFDEPLGALHCLLRNRLTELFKTLSLNHLVLIVTHAEEEIKRNDSVIKVRNGTIISPKFKAVFSNDNVKPIEKKKISAFFLLKRAFLSLKQKKKRSLFSVFASSFALITFGLIYLLSSSLKDGLSSYFSQDEGEMLLIQKREQSYNSTDFTSCSYAEVSALASVYPSLCAGVGKYYEVNYETMFPNRNRVYFKKNDNELSFPSLSFRNIAEFTTFKEQDEITSSLKEDYKLRDIGLELKAENYFRLAEFLETDYRELNKTLEEEPFYLSIEVANESFGYHIELNLRLREVFSGQYDRFFHTSPLFFENLFENEMKFRTVNSRSISLPNPWTVYASYTLLPFYKKKLQLLRALNYDSRTSDKKLSFLGKEIYPTKYTKNDGCFELMHNFHNDIHLSTVKKMQKCCLPYIEDVGFSTGFYYYALQGKADGFLKPVYISDKREKLNEIADYNYEAEFDLEGFQGSTVVSGKGVIMGDLSNSVKKPLRFHTLNNTRIIYGRIPEEGETAVSSYVASYLYGSPKAALNRKLYLSCLTDTVYKNGGYRNIFKDSELIIRGISDDKENCYIYGTEDFLLNLGNDGFALSVETLNINYVIIRLKKDAPSVSLMKKMQKYYPDYRFSLPQKEMEEEITSFVRRLEDGMALFALLSSLVSSFLLLYILLLFIKEEERITSLRLAFGFSLNNIMELYSDYAFLLCLGSYLESSLFLLLFSFLFNDRLSKELGLVIPVFKIELYLLNLFLSLFLFLVSSLLAALFLKNSYIKRKKKRQF